MTRFRNIGLMILLLLAGRMAAQVSVIDSVCPGTERNYRVDGEPGSTYSWILRDPGGNQTLLPSDADTLHMRWDYDPGIYDLQVIQHSLFACDADAVYGQVIIFKPADVYAGADQIIPNGTNTTIGDATATGLEPLIYFWEPSHLLVDPKVLNPTTLNLYQTTDFILTVFDGRECQNSDTMTVFIEGEPLSANPTAIPDSICFGGSSQLFANASGGSGTYSYFWTSDPPGFTSTDPNPLASPFFTTTYYVEVNDGYNITTGSVTVTVNVLPEVYAGADQIIVSGTSTTIGDATASGAGPLTYFWTPAGLLVDPTLLHPTTVILFSTTTFTLTVTDNNGCQNSDEVLIVVASDSLAVDPSAEPDTICLHEPAQLFANASGGSGSYTYSWTSNPPGFATGEENPVVAPEVTTTYIVEVNDGFGTVTDSTTVTVNPLPEVYAGADQTILTGTSTTIGDATATGAEPLTYAWAPANLLLDPTVLNPTTVALDVTTEFTLTVLDSNGCENNDEVTIVVEGEPLVVNPTAEPGTICFGETVQLHANATGGSGSYTYSWTSVPAGFTADIADPAASPLETTTYTVAVNDGSSIVTGSVTVIVHALPKVFAGDDQIIPLGTSTTIGDATASGAEPLIVSWEPASLLIVPTVLNPVTIILNATATFTLTVTDANGCMNSDQVTISVAGLELVVNPTAEPEEICAGDTAQLFVHVAGGSGTYTYSWTSDPPGFTSGEANPLVSPAESTEYTVEVNDGYNTVYGTVEIDVYPIPIVTCPGDTAVCEDAPAFELTGATPAGGIYGGEGVYLDVDKYYFDVSLGAGIYPVTYTFITEFGCTDSCSFVITINEKPEVLQTLVTDETNGQGDGAIEILATAITPQVFFSIDNGLSWQVDDGLFENLSAGIYQCIVRDEHDCDTSFVIIIRNNLITNLQAITGPDSLCQGNVATVPVRVDGFNSVATFQLKLSYNVDNLLCLGYTNPHSQLADHLTGSVNQDAGEITLQWQSDIPLTFVQIETVAELVFTTREAGLGQLEWYATAADSYFLDISGAPIPAEFYAGQVIIYEPPVIFLSDIQAACEGQPVTVEGIAQGMNPPLTYQWTYPNGQTSAIPPYFDSVTMTDAGYYTLLVTDALGCTDQKTDLLVIYENPVAAFHGTDTLTVPYGYILEAGPDMASYLWNTGEIMDNITITAEGWYWVEMESLAGCMGIDSVYVRLLPPDCIYIPNAFTPNGDGLNDTFKAVMICPLTYYRLLIYNRWGEKLFESNDISIGWDGTKNGVQCPGDAYVYMITYTAQEITGGEVKDARAGIVILLK